MGADEPQMRGETVQIKTPVKNTFAVAAREVEPAVIEIGHRALANGPTGRTQFSEALRRPVPGLPDAGRVAWPGRQVR